MNVHNRDRTIYLARAGEAKIEHLYKADADLSTLGWEYAEQLTRFITQLRRDRLAGSATASLTSSPVITSPPLPSVGPSAGPSVASRSSSQNNSPTEIKCGLAARSSASSLASIVTANSSASDSTTPVDSKYGHPIVVVQLIPVLSLLLRGTRWLKNPSYAN